MAALSDLSPDLGVVAAYGKLIPGEMLQLPQHGMINVHVAPAMYIGMRNFSFLADDQIEVTGMTSFLDGNKSFVARVIKKENGKALTLRGKDGKPLPVLVSATVAVPAVISAALGV